MEVLLAQIVGATVSVTGGALLALLLDRGRGRRAGRVLEVNALRLLTIEIASRRALAVAAAARPLSLDRADPDSDLNRIRRSVVLLRKDIRIARKSLEARSGAWEPLDHMVAACNRFLEAIDEHPSQLSAERETLRLTLDPLLVELCATHPRELEFRPAGSAAYGVVAR